MAVVAELMLGSSVEEVNPLGPVHAYVPAPVLALRLMVCPTQIGLLFDALTVGIGFTVTITVNEVPAHPLAVGVTV
jgi:hypothetical protein